MFIYSQLFFFFVPYLLANKTKKNTKSTLNKFFKVHPPNASKFNDNGQSVCRKSLDEQRTY